MLFPCIRITFTFSSILMEIIRNRLIHIQRPRRIKIKDIVTYKNPDGTRYLKAYSIKPNKSHLTDYALKNFAIEQAYWGINGIHIEIIFSDNLNKILASNIQQCVQYYNIKTVQSKIDLLKHLIARKIIQPDMETNYLNFPLLAAQYLDNPNQTQILLDQYEKNLSKSNAMQEC